MCVVIMKVWLAESVSHLIFCLSNEVTYHKQVSVLRRYEVMWKTSGMCIHTIRKSFSAGLTGTWLQIELALPILYSYNVPVYRNSNQGITKTVELNANVNFFPWETNHCVSASVFTCRLTSIKQLLAGRYKWNKKSKKKKKETNG